MWLSLVEYLNGVQVAAGSNPASPTTSKQSSLCFHFFYKKVVRPLPCFSSFTKSHARFVCSVVNALPTPLCRYQLFVSFLTRYEHTHHIEEKTLAISKCFLLLHKAFCISYCFHCIFCVLIRRNHICILLGKHSSAYNNFTFRNFRFKKLYGLLHGRNSCCHKSA